MRVKRGQRLCPLLGRLRLLSEVSWPSEWLGPRGRLLLLIHTIGPNLTYLQVAETDNGMKLR
jgi:hypothetical protein